MLHVLCAVFKQRCGCRVMRRHLAGLPEQLCACLAAVQVQLGKTGATVHAMVLPDLGLPADLGNILAACSHRRGGGP